MAYPTDSVDAAVDEVDRLARNVKQFATRRRDEMTAGDVPSTSIFDVMIQIKFARQRLAELAITPGIVDRARASKNDETIDVVAEFNAMLAAMDSVVSWVTGNFPKDANGFLLSQTLGDSGPIDRQFTPQQTSMLRTQLDALIATID